jgi:hypothetical protein
MGLLETELWKHRGNVGPPYPKRRLLVLQLNGQSVGRLKVRQSDDRPMTWGRHEDFQLSLIPKTIYAYQRNPKNIDD